MFDYSAQLVFGGVRSTNSKKTLPSDSQASARTGSSSTLSAHRQRDAGRTKAAILDAAKYAFATHGYHDAGIREIAKAAGVNSALVRRYYGSKQELFETALGAAVDSSHMLKIDRRHFGATIVEQFVTYDRSLPSPLSMMILGAADPVARRITVRLIHKLTIKPLSQWLGSKDGEALAARINVLCAGFFLYYEVLRLNTFAHGIDPATRTWLVNSLQAVVDEADKKRLS
jgi:AcrR family transcriptional regulator